MEYIERKTALEAIRNLYPGIPFTKRLMQKWHEENRNFMQCENAIERLPAADVAPVVRCKDCRHIHTGKDVYYCRYWERWGITPNGFCSSGAKMDLEEDK